MPDFEAKMEMEYHGGKILQLPGALHSVCRAVSFSLESHRENQLANRKYHPPEGSLIECLKSKLNLCHLPAATLLTVGSVFLAGCAMTNVSPVQSASKTPAISGNAMGGETPISGATVICGDRPCQWRLRILGAVQLGTTTTTAGGQFTFTTGYTCATGQFVYVTATGGDVSNGNNIINNQEVQIAALGSCANFSNAAAQAAVTININEVSTVAAAYALGNFMTVVPSYSGNPLVYIGAPATNNAAIGSCTGLGTAMTCTAAGLAHAFANAINLTDSVHFDSSVPTGIALTRIYGNGLSSIPQAEIHTLANILQTCTNTTGGVAGDGSACGTLFAVATPTGGTAPTDELQAMVDIAKNPKHNVSSTTCSTPATSVFCLAPGAGAAFQPQLATAPSDWSLAITFSGLSSFGNATATTLPQALALDANDDVYIAYSTASPATGGVAAMTSSGFGIWANAPSAQFCNIGSVATDTVGNVWMINGPTSAQTTGGCYYGLTSYSTSTGSVTNSWGPSGAVISGSTTTIPATTGYGIQSSALVVGIDNLNDVWWGRHTSSCTTCLFENPYIPAGITVTSTTTGSLPNGTVFYGAQTNTQGSMVDLDQLTFDPSNNLYVSDLGTALAYTLKNTGTTNAPTYPANPGYVSLVPTAAGTGLGALDAGNNWWVGIGSKLTAYTTPLISGSTGTIDTVTSVTSTSTSPAKPTNGEVDGAGTLWYPNAASGGQIWFTQLATNTSDYIYTCYAPNGATACSANGTTISVPKLVQIDSTGSLWVPSTTTNYFVQVLGVAAPAWPQISYSHFGVKP